jgi:hypothetical protein
MHCTENSKHVFPEMKLWGLVPNLYSDLYIPMIGLYWNHYFPEEHERYSLFNRRNREKGRELLPSKQRLEAVPCPPLRSSGSAESSHK